MATFLPSNPPGRPTANGSSSASAPNSRIRAQYGGWLARTSANGTYAELLTTSSADLTGNSTAISSGFPSFSHDGKKVVYRVWGAKSTQGDKPVRPAHPGPRNSQGYRPPAPARPL